MLRGLDTALLSEVNSQLQECGLKVGNTPGGGCRCEYRGARGASAAGVQLGIRFRASRGYPLSRYRRRFNQLASLRRWISGGSSTL